MLKGSMARGSVLVSYCCVTKHPKTQKLKSISIDMLTGLWVSWTCTRVCCQLWVMWVALLIMTGCSNKCGSAGCRPV